MITLSIWTIILGAFGCVWAGSIIGAFIMAMVSAGKDGQDD